MFFSLGTLRAVDIKKLSMRLRTPPHSLTKPRFKLSPRHFAEASTAGRSHIWSHQLEPFPSHLCILRTQQSAQRGASKSKATWMKDADTTLYGTISPPCLICPVRPLFYCYHFTAKSPQKFLLCPRPVLHVYPPSLSSLKHILRPIAH